MLDPEQPNQSLAV